MTSLAYQVHAVTRVAVPQLQLELAAAAERNASPSALLMPPDRGHLLALLGHLPAVRRLLGRPASYLWEVKADGDGLVIEDYQRNRTYVVRPKPYV
jgi:hypothetical protein